MKKYAIVSYCQRKTCQDQNLSYKMQYLDSPRSVNMIEKPFVVDKPMFD